MVEKTHIRGSEARILVYLATVHNTRKNVTAISGKLDIDYSYVMRVLQSMVVKGWLRKHQYRRFMFYNLTTSAPLKEAMAEYKLEGLQHSLGDYMVEDVNMPKEKVDDDTTHKIHE